jgi:Tol biopolymer transport system component
LAVAAALAASCLALVGEPAGAAQSCVLLRQVSASPAEGGFPTVDVSGNGQVVGYTSDGDPVGENADGSTELFLFDRPTGTTRQITDFAAGDFVQGPALDHTGEHAVFMSDGDVTSDPFTNVDDNDEVFAWFDGPTPITIQRTATSGTGFTGDVTIDNVGNDITFRSNFNLTGANVDTNAEVFHVTGTGVVSQITDTTGGAGLAHDNPRITGDGTKVVYISTRNPITTNADLNEEIFLDPIGAGTTLQITTTTGSGVMASPDVDSGGSHVVFQSDLNIGGLNANGGQEIFLTTVGGATELVTDSAADDQSPRISDDGEVLVWGGNGNYGGQNPDGSFDVWRWHHDTDTFTNVSRGGSGVFSSRPEVDGLGRHIVFPSDGNFLGQNADGSDEVFLDRCGDPTFSDVGLTHAFFEEIEDVAAHGFVEGFSDGTFRPAKTVTRQAAAAFLFRLSGEPDIPAPDEPTFTDVPESHTFFHEIEWMALEGIAEGFPDGTFRPGGAVTRQSAAAFFFRLVDDSFTDPAEPTFTDVPESHTFFHEIEWLAASGITTGFGDGTFRPGNAVTRQSMAAFLSRLAD